MTLVSAAGSHCFFFPAECKPEGAVVIDFSRETMCSTSGSYSLPLIQVPIGVCGFSFFF